MKLKSDKLPLRKRVAANWNISKTWNTGWSRLWVVCRTCCGCCCIPGAPFPVTVSHGPLRNAPLLSVLMTKAASWQQDLLHSLSARTGTANVKWFNKVFQICRYKPQGVQSIAMTFPTGWKDVLITPYLERSTLAVFLQRPFSLPLAAPSLFPSSRSHASRHTSSPRCFKVCRLSTLRIWNANLSQRNL